MSVSVGVSFVLRGVWFVIDVGVMDGSCGVGGKEEEEEESFFKADAVRRRTRAKKNPN